MHNLVDFMNGEFSRVVAKKNVVTEIPPGWIYHAHFGLNWIQWIFAYLLGEGLLSHHRGVGCAGILQLDNEIQPQSCHIVFSN